MFICKKKEGVSQQVRRTPKVQAHSKSFGSNHVLGNPINFIVDIELADILSLPMKLSETEYRRRGCNQRTFVGSTSGFINCLSSHFAVNKIVADEIRVMSMCVTATALKVSAYLIRASHESAEFCVLFAIYLATKRDRCTGWISQTVDAQLNQ